MGDIEKEIESLRKIREFGSVLDSIKGVWHDETYWYDGKEGLVPLSPDWSTDHTFPTRTEYSVYVIPVGVSLMDALNSPDLNQVRPYQWARVILKKGIVSVSGKNEKNLGIVKCYFKSSKDFRMDKVRHPFAQ